VTISGELPKFYPDHTAQSLERIFHEFLRYRVQQAPAPTSDSIQCLDRLLDMARYFS
jgi:hypothetical protein